MDSRPRYYGGAKIRLEREIPRLHLVTNDEVVNRSDFLDRAGAAMAGGGHRCALQLRAHGRKGAEYWNLACLLKAAALETGASLWINDRLDVALAVKSDGVQLGSRSLATAEARAALGRSCLIGRSVHSPSETAGAFEAGADMALLGNIYSTTSHPERAPLGCEAIRESAVVSRPIVVIGGITPESVAEVVEAGAWGIAVLSGVWRSANPGAEVSCYLQALDEAGICS